MSGSGVFCASAALALFASLAAGAQGRTVAITVDDLPYVGGPIAGAETANAKLLRAFRAHHVPVTGFVIQKTVEPRASGLHDHVGAFAVTTGIGADALAQRFERDLDDYSAIIVKALADRLAEAFAELLHARVRREWGYGAGEKLTPEDLVAERYRGIRPAFGYPACPDHSQKRRLFDLLEAEKVGIELTEHFAMTPAASVSGIYLAHPRAVYFNVGRIGRDQVEDYARRDGRPIPEVERWLGPNLGYEPAAISLAQGRG